MDLSDNNDNDDRLSRSYADRCAHQRELWEEAIPHLVSITTISNCIKSDASCTECHGRAHLRCLDCGIGINYCESCCRSVHASRHIYHTPEFWTGYRFIPAPLPNIIIGNDHTCLTSYTEQITVISLNQRHYITISYCMCCTKMERLVGLKLWPATPHSPQIAFSFSLMELIHSLILECQVSLLDIAKMVDMLFSVQRNEDKKSIYQLLTSSFPYYRAYKHKISQEIFMEDLNCPACSFMDGGGPIFISLDANFRLCRKKKAAQTMRQNTPLLEGRFLDQKSVDEYIESFSPPETNNASCSQFRAGNVLHSSKRYKALEETGVFGAICRHDIPIKMLNLKHGERLGYADFILKDLEHISSSPVNLLYDVGCKLVLHWKANNHTSLLSNYNVSVPIFHSYAHIASCQAKYSPRNKEGFGLCDGENLERLWSYLGKFCKMTKEMSIANRVDVLTDALNHYSRQKITRLCISFAERMDKASKILESETDFYSLLRSYNINTNPSEIIKCLVDEENRRLLYQDANDGNLAVNDNWKHDYIDKLERLTSLRQCWINAISGLQISQETMQVTAQHLIRLECALSAIEGEHQIVSRWTPDCHEYMEVIAAKKISAREKVKAEINKVVKERAFYLNTIAHHAGGQKQANRVMKLISNCSSKVKKLFDEYQSLLPSNHHETPPNITDVFNLQSPFWNQVDHTDYTCHQPNDIPIETQRQLIEKYNLIARAKEEMQFIVSDAANFVSNLEKKLITINNDISTMLLFEIDLPASNYIPENVIQYSVVHHNYNKLTSFKKGKLSVLLCKSEKVFYQLQQATDVLKELCSAYFATGLVRTEHLKNAKKNAKAAVLSSLHTWSTPSSAVTVHEHYNDDISSAISSHMITDTSSDPLSNIDD